MDEGKVLACLKKLHQEIELDAGQDPSAVKDETQPLDGLGGFDSPLIPNIVRGLAKAMGVEIPKGTRLLNPYVDVNGKKLTLRGVAKRFCELYGKKETTK